MKEPPPVRADIGVVVVTWYASSCLDSCLAPLESCDGVKKVQIVDNASGDDTCGVAARYSKVQCIRSEVNLGFGRANNLGVDALLQDPEIQVILLLNQDAWIEPGELEQMKEILRETAIDLLSPLQTTADGSALDSMFRTYLQPPVCPDFLDHCALYHQPPSIIACEFVNAAIWILPRSTWETHGGFHPLFFHYGEDIEYCRRIRENGGTVAITPLARGVHARISTGPQGTRIWTRFQKAFWYQTSEQLLLLTNPQSTVPAAIREFIRNAVKRMVEFVVSGNGVKALAHPAGVAAALIRLPYVCAYHRQRGRPENQSPFNAAR